MTLDAKTSLGQHGLLGEIAQPGKTQEGGAVARTPEYRRLIESMRVMLAIIAGLLMLDIQSQVKLPLSVSVMGFSVYSIALLWLAAQGSRVVHHRIVYWLDACWFLLLVGLAGTSRSHYFMFLFFPIFFAVWRNGYRLGLEIAAVSGLAALMIFAILEPGISWVRLFALPLSLFIVGPVFVTLARIEASSFIGQEFAARIVETLDSRLDFGSMLPHVMAELGTLFGASSAVLAIQTFDGRRRVICWEAAASTSELSEGAAQQVSSEVLALPSDIGYGYAPARHWWLRAEVNVFGLAPSISPISPSASEREKLASLGELIETQMLMTVPLTNHGVGSMRLLIGGEGMRVDIASLERLTHIVDQIGPSIENAYLRERLATEAAETERARIGRDLHDSALQPYIGLKFALEAVQRRLPADNPVVDDLNRLVAMATDELASMREVISGLRGVPGRGGALLSSAVRRQALRFAQLFGIQVDVEVDGDMPVSRRLAGEIFHLVAEGLSNIRRHTKARHALIKLERSDDTLILTIRNENTDETPETINFQPRSLTERAAELGGSVTVEYTKAATTVIVRVPLQLSKTKVIND